MKYWLLPLLILISLFSLSLVGSRAVQHSTDICLETLEKAAASATQENWDEVSLATQSAYNWWLSHQTYLHIVCHRDTLNGIDSLFQRCKILALDGDLPEFHANIAELMAQLRSLADMESFSIKHVL